MGFGLIFLAQSLKKLKKEIVEIYMKTKFLATIVVVAMLFTMAAMPLNSLMASAEGATDTPSYSWNLADVDPSKFSSKSKALEQFKVYEDHPTGGCQDNSHTAADHIDLKNGEIGLMTRQSGRGAALGYALDSAINSGVVVISTAYQALDATHGLSLVIFGDVPAEDKGLGGTAATRMLTLSVTSSTSITLNSVTVSDFNITTNASNRQEITIIIDIDNTTIKIVSGSSSVTKTFAELGITVAGQKQFQSLRFNYPGTGSSWNASRYISYVKISDGALDAGDGDGSDEVVYDWNVGNLDFSDKRTLGDFRIFPSHAGSTCAAKGHDISVHLKLRAGELGLTPYQSGQKAGFTYALNGTIESGKAVISTAFQTGLNMYLHSKDVENLGYGGGMATRFFQLGMGDTSITLYGENGKIVTFSDISIKKNASGRQEILIIIDFDNDTISIDHGGDAPLTANFSELDIIAANEKLGCIGYGFNSNPSSWNEYRYVSSLKVSDGTLYTGGGDGDGDGSGSDDDVTSATYSWNLGNLNFRNYTSVSKLPANLIESHQEHGANSCDKQHSSSNHLILKNGQLGFSPLQTGKIGGVNYYLDEAISSGKVVISTKYQAYTGTGGSAFNMHIHAVDPATLAHGNGTVGSRVFAVSVDSSGKLVLTGKNGAVVSFDAGISTSTLNRQEMIIVIDFDTEEVAIRTGGKVYNTTLEELGHDNANLKKVCAVGFGFGYVRDQGVSPWDLRGYINYLKISDGTLGTGEDDIESPENGDNAIYFGIATVAVVATFAAFARKKKRI